MRKILAAALLITALFAVCTAAAPVVVDPDKASLRAKRQDREPVEGIWALHQLYDPDPKQSRDYRLAVIANNTKSFKNAKYIGVAICNKEGVTRGEVKLLLSPVGDNEFEATWRTIKGEVKGRATLASNSKGEQHAALLTDGLTWDGRTLLEALVRVKVENY